MCLTRMNSAMDGGLDTRISIKGWMAVAQHPRLGQMSVEEFDVIIASTGLSESILAA